MTTQPTQIKDFNVGDKFRFYGESFQVISACQTWTGHNGATDTTPCYGRHCKIISSLEPSNISDILLQYTWMQGTSEVTYAKIIEG